MVEGWAGAKQVLVSLSTLIRLANLSQFTLAMVHKSNIIGSRDFHPYRAIEAVMQVNMLDAKSRLSNLVAAAEKGLFYGDAKTRAEPRRKACKSPPMT